MSLSIAVESLSEADRRIALNPVGLQCTGWCFTLNNYTPEEVEHLKNASCRYVVFGYETAPTTGTPHLQGYIHFHRTTRFQAAKRIIGRRAAVFARLRTPAAAAAYCKKDGDFFEKGALPSQGKRNDIEEFLDWLKSRDTQPTRQEIILEFPRLYLQSGARLEDLAKAFCPAQRLTPAAEVPREGWQSDLAATLEGDADARSITFVVDEEGNTGKSWFCKYMMTKSPAEVQYMRVGKEADLAYLIDESKSIFLFDVQRSKMEFFQYSIVESLKDRLILSTKYQSALKVLRKVPHVVVFCNEHPDYNKLSQDRYNIM